MTADPSARSIDRRQALARIALGAVGVAAACELGPSIEFPAINDGRLAARPGTRTGFPSPGVHPLLLRAGRDGYIFVPGALQQDEPAPLVLLLHGAGGSGLSILNVFQSLAEEMRFVLLAPDSRGPTWDAIRGTYADDVTYIDLALSAAFGQCNIDPLRIGIAGFSDGATYAIGLGRINGDLFRRVVAFSPGFLLPASDDFKPPVYITHGLRDMVLPLDLTSRVIVEQLQAAGYSVTFREFDGEHWIPAALVPEAFGWLMSNDAPQSR